MRMMRALNLWTRGGARIERVAQTRSVTSTRVTARDGPPSADATAEPARQSRAPMEEPRRAKVQERKVEPELRAITTVATTEAITGTPKTEAGLPRLARLASPEPSPIRKGHAASSATRAMLARICSGSDQPCAPHRSCIHCNQEAQSNPPMCNAKDPPVHCNFVLCHQLPPHRARPKKMSLFVNDRSLHTVESNKKMHVIQNISPMCASTGLPIPAECDVPPTRKTSGCPALVRLIDNSTLQREMEKSV
jgi:hypothetical protein